MLDVSHLRALARGLLIAALVVVASPQVGVASEVPCQEGQSCDDGNLCNGLETCDPETGTCGSGTPLDCNDGNSDTVDACSPTVGCSHVPTGGTCAIVRRSLVAPLEDVQAILAGAPAQDLGGPDLKRRLQRLIAGALALSHAVPCCGRSPLDIDAACLHRTQFSLQRVCRRVRNFSQLLQRGIASGRIDSTLGTRLAAKTPSACFGRILFGR